VGKLSPGELVDITECSPSGFCYVDRSGAPDGWVSAQYLTSPDDAADDGDTADNPPSSDNKDCSFGFNIGPGGPNLNINCGDGNPGPFPPGPPGPGPGPFPPGPPGPPPSGDVACFYTGSNFNGQSFCMGPGQRNFLAGGFNDRISSVELHGAARARICADPNLGGYCRNINSDTPNLPPVINDRTSSLRVYVAGPLPPPPPPVPPAPVTYSTGPINLMQTYEADLDQGNVGGPGSDIWYEAVTATNKFITPRNGARLALGDGSNRGFAGCSTESFSAQRISLYDVPVGTYVCVRTSEGRISQFRLNGFAGTTMKLGYTTWAN
jgi:hypothetical protein